MVPIWESLNSMLSGGKPKLKEKTGLIQDGAESVAQLEVAKAATLGVPHSWAPV